LFGNIWTNPGEIPNNNIDDDNNGFTDDVHGVGVEEDPFSPTCGDEINWHPFPKNDPQDMQRACAGCFDPPIADEGGHGTEVAAVFGAIGDNDYQLTGTAWQATIIPIRVTACDESIGTAAAARAFDYAYSSGAKIVNCSWQGFPHSQTLQLIFKKSQEKGLIVTVCASNFNENLELTTSTHRYPQIYDYDNMIVVLGIDQTGAKASSSSYGYVSVDIAAPSTNIRGFDTVGLPQPVPHYWGGTSFAAPMVAGVAALVWAQNPTWTYLDVIDHIYATAHYDSGLAGYCATKSRIDLAAALGTTSGCRPSACHGTCP
jgi:subtilisin family serine protease